MTDLMTPVVKAVASLILLAALSVGGWLGYHHVYDTGYSTATAEAQARQEAALALTRTTDKLLSDKAEADLRTKLDQANVSHLSRQAALERALAAASADRVRLTADLARLHDAAARGDSGTAADSPGTGDPAQAPETPFSLADLMRVVDANYATCQENAVRHQALLDWYNSLREGRAAPLPASE
jgi:hypothetical protein